MPSRLIEAPARCIAVDWSGAASLAGQREHIVAADWQDGVINLTRGRTRAETIAWLIQQALRTPALIVGLDFAFSYPAWFVKERRVESIEDFWQVVAAQGEAWLALCSDPFWGRPQRRCPPGHRAPDWRGYRGADRLATTGRQPSSPFQIGGAGAVGTGSIRGIPWLLELRAAGFSIWPFHAPVFPMAMEIYPRSFTGPVNKSNSQARRDYLQTHLPKEQLSRQVVQMATESEDAFDALCSVIGMARQKSDLMLLEQAVDETALLEGAIFPARPIATSA
jgi:hypothetical protein